MPADTLGYNRLSDILNDKIPSFLPKIDGQSLLDFLWVAGFQADIDLAANRMEFFARFLVESETTLSIPGVDAVAITISNSAFGLELPLALRILPDFSFALEGLPIGLRIHKDYLTPMRAVAGAPNTFEPIPNQEFVDIDLGEIDLAVNGDGDIVFGGAIAIDLPLCQIGQSGIVVEANGITLHLDSAAAPPPGQNPGWRGVHIDQARLFLPGEIGEAVGALTLQNASIGNGGFSGTIATDWNPGLDFTLLGFDVSLRHAEITLAQNALTACGLSARLTLPFFDEPVDIAISFGLDGKFLVGLDAPGGLVTIERAGLLSATLESLAFGRGDSGAFFVTLSGSITPLIPGIEWPTIALRNLSIDSSGKVELPGGWLELGDQLALDFHGFTIELTRVGFGTTADNRRWIGLSGSLQLISGLSAGASVDGLRVSWDPNGGDIRVSLDGVGVELAVPGAFSFKGHVSYTEPAPGEHRFDGRIRLSIDALSLTIDGQIVIGQRGAQRYFAIYVEVDLPAGIPLWATGLGIYGFAGLFALQMEPARASDEAWYGIDHANSWYHRGTVGVTDLQKWGFGEGAVAAGVGITLGTLPDNGLLFNGRALFALVLPGPVIFIEGKANILKSRASLSEEPLLRAIVIIDGRAGTLQVGLDARYEFADDGEVIEIGGSAEFFFSFSDPGAWHLHVGKRDPRTQRIQASIFLHIFTAQAYFMLDSRQVALGAWIGYEKTFSFGPVSLTLEAWIEGNALLGFKPIQFHGDLWLHGRVALSVFFFEFDLSADARIAVDVFKPFQILIELAVHIGLPWPFPDFDIDVSLQWGPTPEPPPLPLPLKEVSIAHLESSVTWPLARAANLLAPNFLDAGDALADGSRRNPPPDFAVVEAAPPPANAPVVPMDCRPQITFGRPVHDDAGVSVNQMPPTPARETIGDPSKGGGQTRVRYALSAISLERWQNGAWVVDARRRSPAPVASGGDIGELFGSWAPVPSANTLTPWDATLPPGVAQTKLLLCSKNPFDYIRQNRNEWSDWWATAYPNYPCVPTPPDETICVAVAECVDAANVSLTDRAQSPGASPTSPVYRSDHPEFRLAWSLPTRPRAALVSPGIVALAFVSTDTATLILDRDVLSIDLQVDGCAGPETPIEPDRDLARCADFTQTPVGAGPNPRRENSIDFTVFDSQNQPLRQTRTVAVGAARTVGLDLGWRCEIALPLPQSSVNLNVGVFSAEIKVIGFDGAGGAIASVVVAGGPNQNVSLSAGGAKIVRLEIVAPGNEAVLHSLCLKDVERPQSPPRPPQVFGQDRDGLLFGPFPVVDGVARVPGENLVAVVIRPRGRSAGDGFCVRGWCATVGLTRAERDARAQMQDSTREALARWGDAGFVFRPYSSYRLRIETRIEVTDWPFQSDAAFNGNYSQTEFAFFQTDGPPALLAASVPDGADPATFETGLETLARYVDQTVPETVVAQTVGADSLVVLPRFVYRANDLGARFRQGVGYVDLMYRLAGRDLTLSLFDNNDQPARDTDGNLVIGANRWGVAETLTLSETDEIWVRTINASTCLSLDTTTIRRARTLGSAGVTLASQTPYEARLNPLLLHDDFRRDPVGATITVASGARFGVWGGWRAVDPGNLGGPSVWRIGETTGVGTPPATIGWVMQESAIRGGNLDNSARKPGTFLVRVDDPARPVNNPSQPSRWTNYRVSAILRSGDIDAIGLAARFVDASNFYLFVQDARRNFRRLLRVRNDNWTVLAEANFSFVAGDDYDVAVDAVGTRLRVVIDNRVVFDVDDTSGDAIDGGTIALYSWDNGAARFADIRVDDLRGSGGGAVCAYRFSFVTGRFSNFVHHAHSGDDHARPIRLPDTVGLADAFAAGIAPVSAASTATRAPAASSAEARAYEAITRKALGAAADQPVGAVETWKLLAPGQNGAAVALWVRTGEPFDWERVRLELLHASPTAVAARQMSDFAPASGAIKIVGWTPGNLSAGAASLVSETITVLLRDGGEPDGWRIERRTLPGAETLAVGEPGALPDGASLASDDFGSGDTERVARDPFVPGMASLAAFLAPVGLPATIPVAPPPRAGVWSSDGVGVISQTSNLAGGGGSNQPGAALLTRRDDFRDLRLNLVLRPTRAGGALGVVFRHESPTRYYRFSVGVGAGASQFRRLICRDGATVRVLWQDSATTAIGVGHALRIDAIGGEIVVVWDGAELCRIFDGPPGISATPAFSGRVGLYVHRNRDARFSGLRVEPMARRRGNWTVSETPTVSAPGNFAVSGRLLFSTARAVASAASADVASSYALALWEPWDANGRVDARASRFTDFAVSVRASVAPGDVAGVFFRYASPTDHYLFLLDDRGGTGALLRRKNGVLSTLWTGARAVSGAWRDIRIEATGSRLRGAIDGIALFDLFDEGGLAGGRVGLHGGLLGGAPGGVDSTAYAAFSVSMARPGWETYHAFPSPALSRGARASGHRIRVVAGSAIHDGAASVTGESRVYRDTNVLGLPPEGVDLRLVDPDGRVVQAGRFAPDSVFAPLAGRICRAADGTGFIVFLPVSGPIGASLPPGIVRVRATFLRDNRAAEAQSVVLKEGGDAAPEIARLDSR